MGAGRKYNSFIGPMSNICIPRDIHLNVKCIAGIMRAGEKSLKRHALLCGLLVFTLSLLVTTPNARADSTHQVVGKTTPANLFATTDHGCLGALRSQIAQGQFNGIGPFGEHFNGTIDPGAHYGTAGENAFLTSVLGVKDVTGFCSSVV